MSKWSQLNLCDPVTWAQQELILFHDHAMTVLTCILVFTFYLGVKFVFSYKLTSRSIYEAQQLEFLWTVTPTFFIILLALPSMRLLYLLDENLNSNFTIKATGNQWYWAYELQNFSDSSFESYMVPTSDVEQGEYRLLEVDNRVYCPTNCDTRIITTSSDVLHAWTIPSLGVKMDSVPGRLNSASTNIILPGVYYGQCSEICGSNHSFMPIVLECNTLFFDGRIKR